MENGDDPGFGFQGVEIEHRRSAIAVDAPKRRRIAAGIERSAGSDTATPGRGSIMRRFIVPGVFFVLNFFYSSGPAFAAPNPLAMSVTQEASEEQRIADVLENYAPLANYLSAVARTQIKIGYSRNMTAELQRTRTASVDILVGPAHIIGSALRYGYEPLATFSGTEKMV